MTEQELRKYIEEVAERGSVLFNEFGYLRPYYHIVTGTGEEVFQPSPHDVKDIAVAMIRALLELVHAQRYAFMDEAWVVEFNTGPKKLTEQQLREAVEVANRDGLSEHPDRKEVLMFTAEDINAGMMTASREIIRHGKKATLGPLHVERYEQSEGRMVGLLPAHGRAQ